MGSGPGQGWGWLSPCSHVPVQNSKDSENSRFQPGLPGPYEGPAIEGGEDRTKIRLAKAVGMLGQ